MLAASLILDRVCGLLERLSAVAVLSAQFYDDRAELTLTTQSAVSLAAIQRSCQGANVDIVPWIRLSAAEEAAEKIAPVTSFLTADAEAFEGFDCGYLQLLGIHLVWYLHRTGNLSTSEANELLEMWNGVRVGV
jgi:hypothetical protein